MSKSKLCALIVGLCVLYGIVMRSRLTLPPEMQLSAVLIFSLWALVAAGIGAGAAVLVRGVEASRARRAAQAATTDDAPAAYDAEDVEPAPAETDDTADGVYQTIISYSRSR